MNLDALADFVDNLVLQHDYPDFVPRSFRVGLPEKFEKAPAKLFSEALGHSSVYVQLASLRWFQDHPGVIKPHLSAILGKLDSNDEWVRMEAVKVMERYPRIDAELIGAVAQLLKDSDREVRKAAAKALGKLMSKNAIKNADALALLKEASRDPEVDVRWKAQKALRLMGEVIG